MRHTVGYGRLKILFVDLDVTDSRFHGVSNSGANGSSWTISAGSSKLVTLHTVSQDAQRSYAKNALFPFHHSRTRAGSAGQRRLLTRNLIVHPRGPPGWWRCKK
jgi:hypothetical protein